jgi:uncharacterized protein (TIGR03083 family)
MSEMATPGAYVDRSSYLEHIAEEGARIIRIAQQGPMDARVAHLGRWQLRDVVAHLGGVHRWAAETLATGAMPAVPQRGTEHDEVLIAWFDEGLQRLIAVLAVSDLDEPCPNPCPGSPTTKGFWARRQAHETTMHRWDIESTISIATITDPLFATDGIDELLDTFTRIRGEQVLTGPVALIATDTSSTWVVSPAERHGRVTIRRTQAEPSDVVATISGPAQKLLLALWHRLTIDEARLSVTGSHSIALDFITGPVSP